MAYAVIETGGKQYMVENGSVLKVEKLPFDVGSKFDIEKVLLVGGEGDAVVGSPCVEGSKVTAEVVKHARSRKILVFKRKRRKDFRKLNGHRQNYTEIKITGISV